MMMMMTVRCMFLTSCHVDFSASNRKIF